MRLVVYAARMLAATDRRNQDQYCGLGSTGELLRSGEPAVRPNAGERIGHEVDAETVSDGEKSHPMRNRTLRLSAAPWSLSGVS
jgi:hypothetical protein